MPVMGQALLESARLLGRGADVLARRCVDGIAANTEHARSLAAGSPSIVTPLTLYLGYEAAADVAKKAVANKLARACYHMLRRQEPFDVNRAFG